MSDGADTPPAPPPGLLVPFAGERPPAPAWFTQALAVRPERLSVEVAGAAVETLAWGERGRPGLVLLHGNGAHADWWSPIAPFFAADGYRVVAPGWSGMGGSDWRSDYSLDLFADEMHAACEAAGVDRPIVIAHSFGGFAALHAVGREPGRYAALVSVDSPVRPPGHPGGGPPLRTRANPVYATLAEALGRFRLVPQQACENLWYLDHVARGSVRAVEGGGFTWRFDPFVMRSITMFNRTDLYQGLSCPLAVLYGDRSVLVTPDVIAHMRATAPPGTPFIPIIDAAHHLMLDQPLPFVAAIRGLLAGWPR